MPALSSACRWAGVQFANVDTEAKRLTLRGVLCRSWPKRIAFVGRRECHAIAIFIFSTPVDGGRQSREIGDCRPRMARRVSPWRHARIPQMGDDIARLYRWEGNGGADCFNRRGLCSVPPSREAAPSAQRCPSKKEPCVLDLTVSSGFAKQALEVSLDRSKTDMCLARDLSRDHRSRVGLRPNILPA